MRAIRFAWLVMAASLPCMGVLHARAQENGPAFVSPEDLAKIEAALPEAAPARPKQPRHILIFSRVEGYVHACIPVGNAALKRLGEKTGAYTADVSQDMAMFDRENLERFDAVLFNNCTSLTFPDAGQRRNLLGFVRSGKGFVGIHAATDSFYNWPEGAAMIGGQFDLHPWTAGGTWAVKVDEPTHPLNRSFEDPTFLVTDEIYQIKGDYSRETHRVLLSLDMTQDRNWDIDRENIHRTDDDFAIAWVKPYGDGRVFYCSLGHNNHIFWDPAILSHYLAGIQYALGDLDVDDAPSRPPLEGLTGPFAVMAAYQVGQNREAIAALEESLRTADTGALRAIETDLLGVLRHPDATTEGKMIACRLLRRIGSAESVPVLASLLPDPVLSHAARFALSGIPGPEPASALRQALGQLDGPLLIGVITSLAGCRDTEAVPALIGLADATDPRVADAAIVALGRIGGSVAAEALAGMDVSDASAASLLDARLAIADSQATSGAESEALATYVALSDASFPPVVRAAAIGGAAAIDPAASLAPVLAGLRDPERHVRIAAATAAGRIPGATASAAFTGELPGVADDLKPILIAALASRGDASVRPAVIEEIKSRDPAVRMAAVAALGVLGNEEVVGILIERMREGGEEGDVARDAIQRLRGDGIDARLLALVDARDPRTCVAAIEACVARGAGDIVDPCLGLALGDNGVIRGAAFEALGRLAPASAVPAMVELAMNPIGGTGAARALVETCRRLGDAAPMASITSALAGADERSSKALLKVLGGIGGAGALDVVMAHVEDPRADVRTEAVRVLASWEDAAPAEALLRIAEETDDVTLHVLVLRGYLRMAANLDEDIDTSDMYRSALRVARRPEERRQALDRLGRESGPASLAQLIPYLDDPALRPDAEAALARIMDAMTPVEAAVGSAALNRISAGVDNAGLVRRANELIESAGGIVGQWAVAGPYREEGERGGALFDRAFDPEQDGAEAEWQVVTVGPNLVLDFNDLYGGGTDCVAYARAVVGVPEAQPARLALGSDDGIKVWLNGDVIHERNVQRALLVDEDQVDVQLKEGDNVVLMKITQLSGGWEVSARFTGRDGEPIRGVRSSAEWE